MHARYSCQGAAALQALADRNTYQLYICMCAMRKNTPMCGGGVGGGLWKSLNLSRDNMQNKSPTLASHNTTRETSIYTLLHNDRAASELTPERAMDRGDECVENMEHCSRSLSGGVCALFLRCVMGRPHQSQKEKLTHCVAIKIRKEASQTA
jgi:hypothetical protein